MDRRRLRHRQLHGHLGGCCLGRFGSIVMSFRQCCRNAAVTTRHALLTLSRRFASTVCFAARGSASADWLGVTPGPREESTMFRRPIPRSHN